MKLFSFLTSLMFSFLSISHSEFGIIEGVVYNPDSTETVPFAIIKIEIGDTMLAVKADFEGKYKFNNLRVGTYNLKAETFFGNSSIIGIRVDSNEVIIVDVYIVHVELIICGGCCWPPPLVFYFPEDGKVVIKRIDIKQSNTVRITEIVDNRSSETYSDMKNQLVVRASRPGDVIYLIDGVKSYVKPILPNASINQITYYLGGVPAKYGDTTGGVVIIQTKSYFDLYYEWLAKQY